MIFLLLLKIAQSSEKKQDHRMNRIKIQKVFLIARAAYKILDPTNPLAPLDL
jgi:hypothetical protein